MDSLTFKHRREISDFGEDFDSPRDTPFQFENNDLSPRYISKRGPNSDDKEFDDENFETKS